MNYIEKIDDFKKVFVELNNEQNDSNKLVLINALFDNVRKNYEEYKDIFNEIPVEYEPYKYHLIRPSNGRYDLLDFLLIVLYPI